MRLSNRKNKMDLLNNLNKRDMFKSRKFLVQFKDVTEDDYINRCIPTLIRSIETVYVSDDTKNFDLDDYIQECLVRANELRDEEVFSLAWKLRQEFRKIYASMCESEDYDYVKLVDTDEEYDEIDIDSILSLVDNNNSVKKH